MPEILGLHHLTAIAGEARENYRFYTQVMGLRLVKKTVNFDDPSVYHLYYGDRTGSPGTLLTFFPYGGPRGRRGAGQAVSVQYPVESLERWSARLEGEGIDVTEQVRFGVPNLIFHDPHGLAVELYEGAEALGRIGGVTLALNETAPTRELLEEMGFRLEAAEGDRSRMRSAAGDFVDLLTTAGPRGTGGAGTVHHIAFRVAGDASQQEWLSKLSGEGYRVSPVMDRTYFRSIYFRSPGGVLFEFATDPPGMAADEPVEELGMRLMLPPQHEPHRARIEATLVPLPPRG